MRQQHRPAVLVLSTLYPGPGQPTAGLFIQERMRHVHAHLPVTVVAPVPWFPLQGLIRRWRPHFRPPAPRHEVRAGLEVHRPRFLCVPGVLKSLDGLFMALGTLPTLRRLRRDGRVDLLDAHFAYPDGYAASLLAAWLAVAIHGDTSRHRAAARAHALARRHDPACARPRHTRDRGLGKPASSGPCSTGMDSDAVEIVGNGVDTERFAPVDRRRRPSPNSACRATAPCSITVGGLTERKGFHRVLDCLPALREHWPGLQYLVVGGASGEGDWRARLEEQVDRLGLRDCVHFLGMIEPERLKEPLSAADVFVLATRNEGWANVLLEAMACGLPVVTTDVGGNREVVSDDHLGLIVPFGDAEALAEAIDGPCHATGIVNASARTPWPTAGTSAWTPSYRCWSPRPAAAAGQGRRTGWRVHREYRADRSADCPARAPDVAQRRQGDRPVVPPRRARRPSRAARVRGRRAALGHEHGDGGTRPQRRYHRLP
ncbi:MAG: glycosyltransferase [Halofilum sp. (in: g-proteobacteria)]|nr:glycosyltransferase [Halofilum sp. (in: g-proteobacteria)]